MAVYPELPQYTKIAPEDLPRMYDDLLRYTTELKFLLEQRDAVINSSPSNTIRTVVTTTDIARASGGYVAYSASSGIYRGYVPTVGWQNFNSGFGKAITYYGSFYDTSTYTLATITDIGTVSFGNTVGSFGVSVITSTKLSFGVTGVFGIQYELEATNTDSTIHDITVWLRKNGNDVAYSTDVMSVPNKHGSVDGHAEVNSNHYVSVSAGDYFEVCWHTDHVAITLTPKVTGTGPAHPPSPSASVFITQV